MATGLQLESFDGPGLAPSPALSPALADGYQEGYVAGVTETEAKMLAAQDHLKEGLIAAVQEAGLTQAAAQQQLIASMRPLLEAIVTKVLPHALLPALCASLRDLITQALEQDAKTPLTLRVAPDHLDAVQTVLGDFKETPLVITADPSLSGPAAWIVTPRSETTLDLNATLQAISDQVASLQHISTAAEA